MFKIGKNEEKLILILIIVVIGFAAIYKFVVIKPKSVEVIKKDSAVIESERVKEQKEPVKIYVYVTGEVNKPGLYVLKAGDRVIDIVNMAGGFTKDADITSVNLAEKLRDEEYINIAKKSSDININTNTQVRSPVIGGRININIATAEEIDKFLPGIGETLSNNIVSYRTKNGRFKSIDEVTRVDGLGSGKRFEKIKDLITIN